MPNKSAEEVFNRFKDYEYLKTLAERNGIDTADKSKSEVIEELIARVKTVGMECLLKTLKVATARSLAEDLDWSDQATGKAPNNRLLVVGKLCLMMGKNPAKFLKKRDFKLLHEIAVYLDEDEEPEDKEQCIQLILEQAEGMGLEHIFSAFSVERLKDFCKSCSLQVETSSYDQALECLMKLENFHSKKEPKQPKKRPDIDENITERDLSISYLRDELVAWLNDHNVPSDGPKVFLAKKIYNTLHNLPLPAKPPTTTRRKKKGETQNLSKSEESVEAEKSEEEKSPKKGKKQNEAKEEEQKEKEEEEEEEDEKEKPKRKRKKPAALEEQEEEESTSPKKSKRKEDKSKTKKGKEQADEDSDYQSEEQKSKKKFDSDSTLEKEKRDTKKKKK